MADDTLEALRADAEAAMRNLLARAGAIARENAALKIDLQRTKGDADEYQELLEDCRLKHERVDKEHAARALQVEVWKEYALKAETRVMAAERTIFKLRNEHDALQAAIDDDRLVRVVLARMPAVTVEMERLAAINAYRDALRVSVETEKDARPCCPICGERYLGGGERPCVECEAKAKKEEGK